MSDVDAEKISILRNYPYTLLVHRGIFPSAIPHPLIVYLTRNALFLHPPRKSCYPRQRGYGMIAV